MSEADRARRINALLAPWVEKTCEQCGSQFRARRCFVKRGHVRYCSPLCSQLASRKHLPIDFHGQRFYRGRDGYYKTLAGERLHHAVWKLVNGEIPVGYLIHHKNQDKENNNIENLELMAWGRHTSLHHRTGRSLGSLICQGCGISVIRLASQIRWGQDKYCSRQCANKDRSRRGDGKYAPGRLAVD